MYTIIHALENIRIKVLFKGLIIINQITFKIAFWINRIAMILFLIPLFITKSKEELLYPIFNLFEVVFNDTKNTDTLFAI